MDWNDFFITIAAVILGIGGTLLGTFFGLFGGIVKDYLSREYEKEIRNLEWRKEFRDSHFINPIIDFIDVGLKFMDSYYAYAVEKKLDLAKLQEMNIDMREKEGWAKARVVALQNSELKEAFDEYMGQFGKFIYALSNNDTGKAFTAGVEARKYAGKVFASLQPGSE